MDTSAQVWYFMLQYLDTASSISLDPVECLGFLFQLSFSTLGQVIVTLQFIKIQSLLSIDKFLRVPCTNFVTVLRITISFYYRTTVQRL